MSLRSATTRYCTSATFISFIESSSIGVHSWSNSVLPSYFPRFTIDFYPLGAFILSLRAYRNPRNRTNERKRERENVCVCVSSRNLLRHSSRKWLVHDRMNEWVMHHHELNIQTRAYFGSLSAIYVQAHSVIANIFYRSKICRNLVGYNCY